jgi:rod shape-determining protein MreC
LGNDIKSFFLDNIGVLNSKTNLLKENDLLKSEIKSNEIDHAIFDVLKKENDDLKDILGRKTNDEKLILGTVLVKPYLSAYDTLIIDVGSSDGIIAHDEVLAEGNTFIGYISEVYNNTSKVTLYSSPGEKVKVLIGSNNIEKEAVGLGGGNFTVEVPKEIDISEGDNITMPSISPNVFGVVEKVESKESDSFQNVFFKNPINVLELKWVEVLAPNVSAPAVKK